MRRDDTLRRISELEIDNRLKNVLRAIATELPPWDWPGAIAYVSIRQVAVFCASPPSTVVRDLERLQEMGLIEVAVPTHGGLPNGYRVLVAQEV